MAWKVEYTNDFGEWWSELTADEQIEVTAHVELLEEMGPRLPFPYSSNVKPSRHSHMRELRIQFRGDPYRIFYAFDSRRVAILLIGGNKAGDDRFYERYVPVADQLWDEHLQEFEEE
jgi:hypothetical protein